MDTHGEDPGGAFASAERDDKGHLTFSLCGAEIDVTDLVEARDPLVLPGGVTLASDRGQEGSLGGLIISTAIDTRTTIEVAGPDARITGLRLMGPDPGRREEHWCEAFCPDGPMLGSDHYYTIPNSRGISVSCDRLEIDNCEVAGFSHVGIRLQEGEGHHIHHSFIHHNQRKGLGYGVAHDAAFSMIERNLFDYNRHSIAGTGHADSGYEARHNVERGYSIAHNFDMHGGSDRGDGTNIAGTYTRMFSNTFFEVPGEQLHYGLRIRGWYQVVRDAGGDDAFLRRRLRVSRDPDEVRSWRSAVTILEHPP